MVKYICRKVGAVPKVMSVALIEPFIEMTAVPH